MASSSSQTRDSSDFALLINENSFVHEESADWTRVDVFDTPPDLRQGAPRPRTLQNSRFLKFYNRVPKQPRQEDVCEHLAHVTSPDQVAGYRSLCKVSAAVTTDEGEQTAQAAVRHWSCGGDSDVPKEEKLKFPPVFKAINRALIADSNDLEHWVWWARALNSHITKPANGPKRDLTTYRGSKIDNAQAQLLRPGSVVRPCMYIASSLDWEVGSMFTGEGRYLLKFRIPSGCRNASVIYHLARMKEEKEVLIPPYSPLWVRSWEDKTHDNQLFHVITVDVLDSTLFEWLEQGTVSKDMAGGFIPDGGKLPDSVFGKRAPSCIV